MIEDKVKELLTKNDYITIVQKSGDGCVITYPHPKLTMDLPRLVESFLFQRGENPGYYISTSFDKKDQKERFVEMPEYVLRLSVLNELMGCNSMIGLSTKMTTFIDQDDNECECLTEILDPPITREEAEKEEILMRFFTEARNIGFLPEYDVLAKDQGIDEGYQIIKNFYTRNQ